VASPSSKASAATVLGARAPLGRPPGLADWPGMNGRGISSPTLCLPCRRSLKPIHFRPSSPQASPEKFGVMKGTNATCGRVADLAESFHVSLQGADIGPGGLLTIDKEMRRWTAVGDCMIGRVEFKLDGADTVCGHLEEVSDLRRRERRWCFRGRRFRRAP
jgi:hypothetical protein